MAGRAGLPMSVSACGRSCLAGRSRALRIGCILSEPGAPKDEGIPRDEGLLGLHRARRRLLHDQVPERQGAQGGLEDLLRPGRLGKTALDSDIVIYVRRGTVATGHCFLRSATGDGLCTISDGTGTLAGFQLRVRVTADSSVPKLLHWDGTYSFSRG